MARCSRSSAPTSTPIRNPIAEFLTQRPVLILDGALATELERRGAGLDDALWSAKLLLERPGLIRALHLDYFRAGADLAITASYQASFEGFARRGIDRERTAQLLRDSVALAAAAREEFWADAARDAGRLRPLIAASIGPYGAVLADGSEYRGRYPIGPGALEAFHRERLEVLAGCGADLIAFETLPSLDEALLLAGLLRQWPGCCAWISFCCADAARTGEGQEIGQCVRALEAFPQVVAVGINCTRPDFVSALITRMRTQTDRPLVAYPNSGERYDAARGGWTGHSQPSLLATGARAWYAAGARLIGGCCRTGPADIRRLREALASCA